jgi:hypothetical protein
LNHGTVENHLIPSFFWWPEAHEGRKHNWITGDFDVRLRRGKIHCQAYGVEFLRADILAMLGIAEDTAARQEQPLAIAPEAAPEIAEKPTAPAKSTGRRSNERWEDLLIEIAAELYVGNLKPSKQAEIEGAILDWAAKMDFPTSESSIRIRARKIWKLIEEKG